MLVTVETSRSRALLINRFITCATISLIFASYFWQPSGFALYVVDILIRAYLHFVAGIMAHESVHGHLGNTKAANMWWGRLALFPTTVPYMTFRKTHLHHHSFTNIPELDPDEFLNTPHVWQIPVRAIALPYYWVTWLWKTGRFKRRDRVEYIFNYVAVSAVYGAIGYLTGVERLLYGFLISAALHSLVLWYWFAIKTHQGYSTGEPEKRSHNYRSAALYWLTFGLSLHRDHHMKPNLAWAQTRISNRR